MSHPDHECENCGVYHMSYTAIREFEEKQKNCQHSTILLKCKDCKKDLGEGVFKKPMRCEECKGDVVESSGMYLCLSGCGHVRGESR